MLRRYAFGEYTPDRPLSVIDAHNVWPMPDGYRPVKAFYGMTVAQAGIYDGAAFIGSDGTAALLAGSTTNLYRFSGMTWSSLIGSRTGSSWRFDQFGDNIICVDGGAPVGFNIITGAAAALGGSPPVADMVATVRQQVFLAGDQTERNTVFISGYNDSTGWTPGTNQALNVPFPNGGDIMGLCGGETGLILQQRSIRRATFTGDVTVWQFDEISHDIGCMAKGSVAQAGLLVFFLSEQGFKVCDRNSVEPIGTEKIDRTFFARYARADIASIRSAIDPRTTTVMWAMPGNPGTIWAYNWTLGRWSVIDMALVSVFSGFTSNVSIDALDALFPGGIDSIPMSLDSPIFSGGNPLFMVIDRAGVVGTLSGTNLACRIQVAPVEVADGFRVRMQGARAVSDAVTGTIDVDVRARAGDQADIKFSGAIRDNGRVPLRANGRHVGMTLNLPADAVWSYALGLDLEFSVEGSR